jgi:hypothetical protein
VVLEKDGEYQCKNEEVLYRHREKKILHTIERGANWICLVLRRECFVKKKTLLRKNRRKEKIRKKM